MLNQPEFNDVAKDKNIFELMEQGTPDSSVFSI